MLKFLIILFGLCLTINLNAQQVTNIKVTQEGDKVVITYDILSANSGQTFDIKIECSADGGKTFLIIPQSLTGDFKNLSAGPGKQIVWDVLTERQELAGDQFIFQLVAIINNVEESYSGDYGTFTDSRDGQVYNWVKIGDQVWMAENLKTTKYLNGDPIKYVSENSEWRILTAGAYCNCNTNIINALGYLYNWYTVKDDRKIAPEGWHLPNDADWTKLTDYLGGKEVAGAKMKFINGWKGSGNGNNASGFAGLAGGYRYSNGEYSISGLGCWWSSNESIIYGPYSWTLDSNSNSINIGSLSKAAGLSIRCIKD